jgi:hypothetical protein
MASLTSQTKFNNSVITEENNEFFLEEFKITKDGVESLGKFSLTEQLRGIVGVEYVSLGFAVKTELEPDEE